MPELGGGINIVANMARTRPGAAMPHNNGTGQTADALSVGFSTGMSLAAASVELTVVINFLEVVATALTGSLVGKSWMQLPSCL